MKQHFSPFALLISMILIMNACNFNHNMQWSFFGKPHTSMVFEDQNGVKTKVKFHGDFVINDAENGFESMSSSALMTYSKGNIQFNASSDESGKIIYTINDKVTTGTVNEMAIIAEVISDLINVGFASEQMAEKWYKKGGMPLFYDKVKEMKSDFIMAQYIAYIVKQPLDAKEQWKQVFELINRIQSDFERSNVLQKIPSPTFHQYDITEYFLQSTKQLGSDFEKAGSIKYLFVQSPDCCNSPSLEETLASLNSDYEKSIVLQTLLEKSTSCKEMAFVPRLIKTMDSDFEKAQVLKKYFSNDHSDPSYILNGLEAISTVGSDFEVGSIMKVVSDKSLPKEIAIHQQVMLVIQSLESNFEKSQILNQWMPHVSGEDQWVTMIEEIGSMNADYEKEQLLEQCLASMLKTQKVNEAYINAVKSLDSDMAKGKLLSAVQ